MPLHSCFMLFYFRTLPASAQHREVQIKDVGLLLHSKTEMCKEMSEHIKFNHPEHLVRNKKKRKEIRKGNGTLLNMNKIEVGRVISRFARENGICVPSCGQ